MIVLLHRCFSLGTVDVGKTGTNYLLSERMRLWLDNTGLHSAGLCLLGRARNDSDIRGLLQLATFLVFSESLLVNGFEADSVLKRTWEIKGQLVDWGLEYPELSIVP